MLTRVHNDACSVSDEDLRNAAIYERQLNNIPFYRRGYALNSQIYPTQTNGLEMDVDLESKLRGVYSVNNSCNLYGAGVQADIQQNAPQLQQVCISNALTPAWTRMTRVARQIDIHQSSRAKPGEWHFYPVPVPEPNDRVFQINRTTATQRITKDQLEAQNRQLLLARQSSGCPQALHYGLNDGPLAR